MENNQSDGNKKIYLAIIIMMLITNSVTLFLLFITNKEKTDVTTKKIALESDFRNLNDTLDAKKKELEELRGDNEQLDSIINAKQEDIDKQKKTIAGLFAKGKMTAGELKKA